MKKIITKLTKQFFGGNQRQAGPVMYSKGQPFIFIHINKTGGTSVASAIGLDQKCHLTANEIVDVVGLDRYRAAYKFCVVRNPWSRCVSQYHYRVKTNQNGMKDGHIQFPDWVRLVYGPEKDARYYDSVKFFQSQSEWLKVSGSDIPVDQVLRFESLSNHFEILSQRLGLVRKLPHYNKTASVDYRNFYDVETAEIVAGWFSEDIASFNFKFDD